jgi:hypothetical protein
VTTPVASRGKVNWKLAVVKSDAVKGKQKHYLRPDDLEAKQSWSYLTENVDQHVRPLLHPRLSTDR